MTGLRVLIIACTDTKRPVAGPVRAVDLYDGPTYRVLRKSPAPDAVLILSAKYGLIDGNALIEPYNQLMTWEQSDHYRTDETALSAARTTIEHVTNEHPIVDCYCVGGKRYACIAREYSRLGLLPPNVGHDPRGIGYKLGSLKNWLEGRNGTGKTQ